MAEPFKVSHSKVKTWRRCRQAYHYKYVLKLRKKIKGRALMFGSIVHEALELLLQGKSAKPIWDLYTKQVASVFEEERVALGLDQVVPDAQTIVAGYLEKYKKDGLKYRAVELEIELPLFDDKDPDDPDQIIFIGKIDGIVSEGDEDAIWVFERKTCKKMPLESIRMTDVQSVLYWWAIPKMRRPGRKVQNWPTPRGIIWDYVRSKAPSIPEPLKKGGLSKARCDTTREVYLQAIKDNGLDPADYSDMLESLKGSEENFFNRVKLPFSRTMRDKVLDDFKSTAIEMKLLHGIAQDRNLTRDCSWCDYYSLCQSEIRGLDIDILLKKDYEVKTPDEKQEVAEGRDSE